MNETLNVKLDIEKLDTLPAMPVIAQKLLTLALDTDEGEAKLLALIAQDPLISAKIIGLANTPLFGSSRKVHSVTDASMLLGLTRVKSVAIGIATMSAVTRLPEGLFKANDLWLHSMAIALVMRAIARAMPARTRPLDDQIFLAGLLHDIGYMALSYLDTGASNELHTRLRANPEDSILQIERQLIGMTHGEIGAKLGHHWDLPEDIIAVMQYHHMPDVEEAAIGQPLVSLVNFAGRLLTSVGITEAAEDAISDEEWLELGISTEKAESILEQVPLIAEQAKQLAGTV